MAFNGIDTIPVDVQVHLSNGMPSITIVGLADKAVAESKERVRAALSSIGVALPPKRIAINLAPADINKEGSHNDLPIALGLICPYDRGIEASYAGDIEIIAAPSLTALINHLRRDQVLAPPKPGLKPLAQPFLDMADLVGQFTARQVLEITAAGGHNLLMMGPPGAGKSMLAARLPGILPEISASEALDVTMIHSIAGQLQDENLIWEWPFCDPHHSSSVAALVGGGHCARPGEVSLAHNGILFLDELAEWPRAHLDSLRQTIETHKAVVSRANHHVTYPARFQLIAAMNLCRCGFLGDPARACSREPLCSQQYLSKISGPMLDRFDLIIEVLEVPIHMMMDKSEQETSAEIRTRFMAAQQKDAISRKQQKLNADL